VLGIAGKIGDGSWEAHMLNDIGAVESVRGRFGTALRAFQAALRIHETGGYERGVARSLHNIAAAYFDRGEFILAGSFFRRSHDVSRTLGWKELAVMNLLGRAELLSCVSEHEAALSAGESALEQSALLGDPYSTIEAKRILALLLFERGSPGECFRYLESCIESAKKLGARCELARVLDARGSLFLRERKARAALADLGKAKDLYRAMRLPAKERKIAEVMKAVR
jgi:tetratricopeptide (TPR) repeat protein